MEYKPKRPGYLNIREAATKYEVSRGKLHRLIRLGQLKSVKDSRDARATLVRIEDLEDVFSFPAKGSEAAGEAMYDTRDSTGTITEEMRERMDAIRARIAAKRGGVMEDSTEIIRREREKRGQHLYELATRASRANGPEIGEPQA